jgi:MSHA biogenesis protein MshK
MATGLKLRLLLGALLLPLGVAAEVLPDPTRPAIDLNATAAGTPDVVPDEPATRGLQSILIAPDYRAAVINGETVRLGDKTGDSKLVEVRENSVVLQNAQGRHVLELFPKVSMKKNEAAQSESRIQDNAPVPEIGPENAAGGNK